ncbi:unnamed protein product [Caenorhabditis sp. 36 PRJEB53466]|nr:unnamed protein product [Caenorhabditis sp. 36 PRJEB53466]
MNFKHALIICLIVADAVLAANSIEELQCNRIGDFKDDRHIHFIFFVDRTLEGPLLTRLYYLLKAIACEIPLSDKITAIVGKYSGKSTDIQQNGMSIDKIPDYLSGARQDEFGGCQSFRNALGHVPAPSLDHPNVHFIVPMFGDEHDCYLRTFQTQFKDDSRKENFFFNGILINAQLTEKNNQSVRVFIPDLIEAIDPDEPSLKYSPNISVVQNSEPLFQSYSRMLHDILLGKSVHDWEFVETTTTTTTTRTSSQKSVADDEEEMLIEHDAERTTSESTTVTSRTSSTVTSTVSTAVVRSNVSTVVPSSTTRKYLNISTTLTRTTAKNTSTTQPDKRIRIHEVTTSENVFEYNPDDEEDSEEMAKASGDVTSKGDKLSEELDIPWATTRIPGWEADFMMYVLLLLLLIWLFCLFMCLIWMFYCAKRKKDKIENEAERQRIPLLEHEINDAPATNLASSKSGENEGEEEEEAWKNITPAMYVEALESVRQPPLAARYRPVEVSEFEDGRHDEEANEAPRHGFVPAKKSAELRFE